jgi:hypothetical protein
MKHCRLASYCIALALLTACASPPPQTAVPANLVPTGERQVERLAAHGLQTYECRVTPGDASSAAWVYVASSLELLDANDKPAGRHTYPPPVWEAPDGSKFAGTQKARADAPEAGAAPWLLISTKSTGAEGRFAKITSLQRVNTKGGVAPASGCDLKAIGKKEQVPLRADLILFSP